MSSSTADAKVLEAVEVEVQDDKKKKAKPTKDPVCSMREFLQFAGPLDILLLLIALPFALATGAFQPLMLKVFGDAMDGFGNAQASGLFDMDQMMEMLPWIFLVIFGTLGSNVIYESLANLARDNMIVRWKQAYLKSIIRQDVGWFDTNNPQELSTRIGESLKHIENGLSAKAMVMFEWIGMAVCGLFLCFYWRWDVGLVILVTSPIVVGAGVLMTTTQQTTTKKMQDAYAKAGGIASEALAAMRTIASLGLEPTFNARYEANLAAAEKAGISKVTRESLAGALLLSAPNLMLGIGMIYGGLLLAATRRDSEVELRSKTGWFGGLESAYPKAGLEGASFKWCADDCDPHSFVALNTTDHLQRFEAASSMLAEAEGYRYSDAAQHESLVGAAVALLNASCAKPLVPLLLTCYTFEVYRDANVSNIEAMFGYTEQEWSEYAESEGSGVGCRDGVFGLIKTVEIMLAIFALQQGMQGLGQIAQPMGVLQKARVAAVDVLKTISRVPTIDSFAAGGTTLADDAVRGAIEVADVHFAYPSAPEKQVCQGYSLSIGAGQFVALVGPSGCGKSTLIQLLERFYDPTAGSITLDGVDLKELNLKWLRQQIGLVGQEPVLFVGTVGENIAYGKEGGASQAEIEEAARMANAHAFISDNLSDSYATQVGQGGGKLSGGQKQRVAIARAIIKKPKILLLDEATSALDTESERVVQAALDEVMKRLQRTTVAIAHRLSTIRHADKIAVINEGRVVEEGTYDELLAIGEGGLFYTLAQKSAKLERGRGSASNLVNAPEAAADAKAGGAGAAGGGDSAEPPAVVKVPSKGLGRLSKRQKSKEELEADEAAKAAKEAEKLPEGVVSRLFGYANKGDGTLLGFGFVCSFFAGFAGPVLGLTFSKVLGVFYVPSPEYLTRDVLFWAIFLWGLSAVTCAFEWANGVLFGSIAEHLTRNLRAASMRNWVTMEQGFFDEEANSAGELTQFLSEKVTLVHALVVEKTANTTRTALGLVSGIGLMFVFGYWEICLAMFGGLFVMVPAMSLQMMLYMGQDGEETKKAQGKTTKKAAEQKTAGALVGEVVLGIRTVASFCAEHKFYNDYVAFVKEQIAKNRLLIFLSAFLVGFSKVVPLSLFFGLFFYGFFLLDTKYLERQNDRGATACGSIASAIYPPSGMDGIMAPLMIIMMMAVYIGQAASTAKDAKAVAAAANALFARLDRKSKLDGTADAAGRQPPSDMHVQGALSIVDVHFAYPTRPDFKICSGLSIEVAAGETVALVGPSGCGKSTLIQLLERFYDPTAGSITLDGVDLKELNLKWLRQQIGLVGQEPVMFMGTVFQNIANGKQGATRAEVEEAARMANAHAFIAECLENGYDTEVGIRGGRLSGGQKQRVAIARALVRQPKILLLDEATSALDNESERIVQAALDEIIAKQRRTTVTIAHRLTTIRNANKIVVLKKGAVVETGTHDELLSLEGVYRDLWDAQQ